MDDKIILSVNQMAIGSYFSSTYLVKHHHVPHRLEYFWYTNSTLRSIKIIKRTYLQLPDSQHYSQREINTIRFNHSSLVINITIK